MARIRRLTPNMLRKMVLEEKRRLQKETSDPVAAGDDHPEDVEAAETDADEYAEPLEKDIDFIKALKIQERKLKNRLNKISEAKKKLRRRVIKRL